MRIKDAIDAREESGSDIVIVARTDSRHFVRFLHCFQKWPICLKEGGKTPILNLIELEEIGFEIVCYPLSLIGVSIRAMKDALTAIKCGCLPPLASLPSFDEITETLGFNAYYEEEKRYGTSTSQRDFQR
ncbi:Phosphoenolpyruvate carboxylase family protein, partial [Thalictrum thalictroides]